MTNYNDWLLSLAASDGTGMLYPEAELIYADLDTLPPSIDES
jgi:hypothetical protein